MKASVFQAFAAPGLVKLCLVCVLAWGLPQADARPTKQKPHKPLVSAAKQPKTGTVGKKAKNAKPAQTPKTAVAPPPVVEKDGVAEARLMDIYRLMANRQFPCPVRLGPDAAASWIYGAKHAQRHRTERTYSAQPTVEPTREAQTFTATARRRATAAVKPVT